VPEERRFTYGQQLFCYMNNNAWSYLASGISIYYREGWLYRIIDYWIIHYCLVYDSAFQ
jgi:hypothetical protein